MEGNNISLSDMILVIKRRKWALILPTLFIFLAALVLAAVWPSYYKSDATILIEEQEIPSDFVMATVTSYAEQRLQTINQQIMSSTRLLELINRLGLYSDLRNKWTTEEIVAKMREDIKFATVSADVIDRKTGRPTTATIAFTLSYEGKDPGQVQQVANELASFFLQENLKVRERQTVEASQFLEEEMNKVKAHIDELEKTISEFKEKNINKLPELLQVNLQTLNNIEQSVDRMKEDFRALKEREGYLQTQLAGLSPEYGYDIDQRRLAELKVQLVTLESKFSNEYPDVMKVKAEIAELQKRLTVINGKSKGVSPQSDNPTYITLSSQLASTRAEIESVQRQIRDAEKKRYEYGLRIESTPKIEGHYNALIAERNNNKAKYDDLMRKLMEARVAHGLEKEQKGERFNLIDPARLPEKPFKPNRLAILLVGLVLGLGVGIGLVSILEFSDDSVRHSFALSIATSFPVLANIPLIETKSDVKRNRIKRVVITSGMFSVIIIGIAAFHFLVMDLDVLWARFLRKMVF